MEKSSDSKKRAHDSRSAFEAVKGSSTTSMGPPPRPSPRTPPIKRLSTSSSTKSTITSAKTKKPVRPKSTVATAAAADDESRASASPTPADRSIYSPQSTPEKSKTKQLSVDAPKEEHIAQGKLQKTEEAVARSWTPREPLEKFNQEQLFERYEAQMQHLVDEEHQVWRKIGRLNQLLEAWATVGSAKEIERSRKRLRTRVAYVDHQESKVEKSQAHYMNIRKALQSALEKLDIEEPNNL